MGNAKPPIADAIRKWRLAKGWTRKQAAKHLGVTERSLENWEYGHRNPPALNMLEKLWASRRGK